MTAATFTRTLPDPVALVAAYLRDPRAALDDVTVLTQLVDPFTHAPAVVLTAATGGTVPHWRFTVDAVIDIDCYALDDRAACADLAERVRVALSSAWARGDEQPGGHLVGVDVTSWPVEQRLDGQAPDEFRYTSTFQFLIRTARA